jgi:aspartate racemase
MSSPCGYAPTASAASACWAQAFTMREAFFRDRLERHGIAVAVPSQDVMSEVDRIIFGELVRGQVSRVSQRTLRTQINAFAQAKAQAVVLGCTELVLAVDVRANIVPVYDTTCLHAEAAVDWMMMDAEFERAAA